MNYSSAGLRDGSRSEKGHLDKIAIKKEIGEVKFERKYDPDTGVVDSFTGTKPEYNFRLTTSDTGETTLTNSRGDNPQRFLDNSELDPSRSKLLELAKEKFKDPMVLSKFKADMIRFENRASARGIGPEAISDTYKEISRFLNPPKDTVTNSEQQEKIASQVMSYLGSPTSISQGLHETCVIKSIESIMYTKHPALTTKLMADATLKGEFKGVSTKAVKIPENAFMPSKETKAIFPGENERSLAGQVFDYAIMKTMHGNAAFEKGPSRGWYQG